MASNITAEQLRAARAICRVEQKDVAAAVGVSAGTIKRLEAGEGPLSANVQTVAGLIRFFEAAGIEFIPENGGGAGVRLAKAKDAG